MLIQAVYLELVGDYGISIKDNQEISFDDKEYELNYDDIVDSYINFKTNFSHLKSIVKCRNYDELIEGYFTIFKNFL